MELVENDIMNIRDVTDIGGLLKYFHDHLGWNRGIDAIYDIDEIGYEFTAADLGLKEEEFAKVKSLYQLPPLEEDQQWGIFCVEFNTEKFSVTALRKILSRLVPTRRNATMHTVWDEKDLLFLCLWGTGGNRTICAAHFEQQANALSQVRTIHCSPAVEDAAVLAHFEKKLGKLQWPIDVSDYESWHGAWVEAFDTYWGEVIKTSAALAERMAKVAKDIKDRILEAMRVETANGFIHLLFDKVQRMLVHDLDESDFADMYAQTIVYGLFSARCLDKTPDTFSIDEAIELIPNTNPFLKNMMRDCCAVKQGGGVSFDELGVADVVDMFAKVDAAKIAADFGKQSGGGREDPVIYFYEEFLKAYDKEQKVKCGEFYTPMPVVGFMVRAVDHILRTQFNMPDGLATEATKTVKVVPEGKKKAVEKKVPAIQILDPALGTGTFLREIILNIFETFKKNYAKSGGPRSVVASVGSAPRADRDSAFIEAWSRYVDRNVLPRLNGFELMMAPYAIAHMKLAMVLQDTGYDFKGNKRLQVYLTNSLEEPGNSDKQMTFFDDPLAAESVAANVVKKNTGINIVIGNPPYSVSSNNKGEWITNLIKDYKKDLNEKNIQPLSDDYIKFIRLGQGIIERSGSGILAYISNNKFIDGLIHRRVRKELLRVFDKIYVLNLHGDARKQEVSPDGSCDQNVFDIIQGVAISIFVKSGLKTSPHSLLYADFYGTRDFKNARLNALAIDSLEWRALTPAEPRWYFVPKDFSLANEYESGFIVSSLFEKNGLGVKFRKDNLLVHFSKAGVVKMLSDVSEMPVAELQQQYNFKETPDWRVEDKRMLFEQLDATNIRSVEYRAFDIRYCYYPFDRISKIIVRGDSRKGLMQHMLHENVALALVRNGRREGIFNYFVAQGLIGKDLVSSLDNCNVFPLYLYEEYHGKMQKVPNLNSEIVKKIETALGEKPTPEDIFNYIYAVLHSPTYREKYKEFLKIDFPRIPYPTSAEKFHALAALGAQLVAIHTMKDFDEADDVAFEDAGGCEVGKVSWKDGAVYINKESRFTGVEEATFNQYIGGYQPLQKWLKDRKGRKLSDADISHYKRIVRALRRTAALMSEIDKLKGL